MPIGPAENSLDYSFSGFSGTEVATVDVDEAGSYSMVVETRREGEFAIAIGKDVVSTVLPWILGAMALAAVGLILGLIILIVTGWRPPQARGSHGRGHRLSVRSRCLHAGAAAARPLRRRLSPPFRSPCQRHRRTSRNRSPSAGGLSTERPAFAPPPRHRPVGRTGSRRRPATARLDAGSAPAARTRRARAMRTRTRGGATARAGAHRSGRRRRPAPPPSATAAVAGSARAGGPPASAAIAPGALVRRLPAASPSSATAALLTLRGRRCRTSGRLVSRLTGCYGFVSVG